MKDILILILVLIVGFFLFNSYTQKQEIPVYVVMAHEVRTFTSCNDDTEFWVLGSSPAYTELLNTYQEWVKTEEDPYAPLLVNVVGKIVDAPDDGFGADYDKGFEILEIVESIPGGVCG